ncbi:MAG: AAA family ATPase [Haloferacaceae archaeon]
MGLTLVSGVPGVGASTVCEAARQRLDDDVQLLNFRDVMLEQAAARGLAGQRTDLDELSPRETRRLQRRAGEYVADRSEAHEVLLNTYLAVETAEGYLTGATTEAFDRVLPDRFVLIEAAPATIVERRADSDRDYSGPSEREVRFQQEVNRTATVSFAAEAASPVRHLENEGPAEETAASLVEAVHVA